jgi:hypothetical protein
MRLIRVLSILASLVVVAVLVLAALQPDVFRLQRSTTIAAPAAKVHPFVDDFRRWTLWSPFEARDPTMRRSYGATTAGPGATYAWDGDGEAGAGTMTIVESTPARIGIALDFRRPMESRATVAFTFVPAGDATLVTWAMEAPNSFASKVVHVFFDAEKLVGADFERGLASLKAVAER